MPTVLEQLKMIIEQQRLLYEMLKEAYEYMPYIYEQKNIPTGQETVSEYSIIYPSDDAPKNGLLFLLPKFTNTQDTSKLRIKYTNETKFYTIYLENNDGSLIKAPKGSIIANRLAILRFINGDDDSIILTNNPYYNSLKVSELRVSNKTVFRQIPLYLPEGVEDTENISEVYRLALYTEFDELRRRVERIERMFVIGEKDIKDVAEELEDGQIYMKVSEIEL